MQKEFQKALIQSLFQDVSLIHLIPTISSKVFDAVEDQVLLDLLRDYVKQFRALPSKAEIGEFLQATIRSKGTPSDVIKLIVAAMHEAYLPIDGEQGYVKQYLYGEIMGKRSALTIKDFMSKLKDTPTTEVAGLIDWMIGELSEVRRVGGGSTAGEATIRTAGYIDQAVIKPDSDGIPTIFPTMNKMMAAGGFRSPELIVILSSPKGFKTGTMLALAVGYMKMGKKIYYADVENGEFAIRERLEQCLLQCTWDELKDPNVYGKLNEIVKWSSKLGGQFLIDAYSPRKSCFGDIRMRLEQLKRDDGFVPDVIFIDPLDQLLPTLAKDRARDERHQLTILYFEAIALNKDLGCFTVIPSQVNRAGIDKKVFSMKDFANDFGKAANAHSAWALCRTDSEVEAGIARLVPVMQRQGVRYSPTNVCVLHIDESRGIVEEIDIDNATERLSHVVDNEE
jgi:hypothetical protein